jgi:hypothetical protein
MISVFTCRVSGVMISVFTCRVKQRLYNWYLFLLC